MGKSERLGIFPTVGISWNMQNEPFMKNAEDWMDEIKLRFSIGQSGNAPKGTGMELIVHEENIWICPLFILAECS